MAKLPIIRRLQGGGTATEDIPAQPGGAGGFPSTTTTDPEGYPIVKPISSAHPN